MQHQGVKYEMFGGDDAEMYNALHASFCENAGGKDAGIVYGWIDETPKTSMIVSLVDKLKEMGYGIYPLKD